MATQSDKYIIDLRVEQGKGLTSMEAMVKRMQALRTQRTALNKALKDGLITENQHAKQLNRIQVELKGLSGRYREASNAASGLTKQGIRFRDKMAGAMTSSLVKLGGVMAATFAVTRVVSFVRTSINQIANFEEAVSKLRGITQATDEQIQKLTKTARELAAASKFTATQVIDAQTELAKLGQSVEEIDNTTESVLMLATAAGSSIPQAAEVAQQTMNAFQIEASRAGEVVDIMAKSFTSSALNIDRWQNGMKSAGAAAKAVDMDIRDAAAALSVLVDAGIPAEKAGTDLRNILIALEKEGLTWADALGQIKDEQNQLTFAVDLFGQRSGLAGVILAEQIEKTDRLSQSYGDAAGSAAELAAAQLDNLKGDRLLLASAWEEFLLSVEDGTGIIGNFSRDLTRGLTNLVQDFTNIGNEWANVTTKIARNQELINRAEKEGKDLASEAYRERLRGYQLQLQSLLLSDEGFDIERDKLALENLSQDNLDHRVRKLQGMILLLEKTGAAEREIEAVKQRILFLTGEITKAEFERLTQTTKAVEEEKGIIPVIQDRIKFLREARDAVTESTGGTAEIKRLTAEIAKEQQKINDLLGKGAAKTKAIEKSTKKTEENLFGWTKAAADYIKMLDEIDARGRIGSGFGSTSDEDDFTSGLVDEALQREIDAYEKMEAEKTRLAKEGEDRRREIQLAGVRAFEDTANILIRNEQERSNRREAMELDLLAKMRQANEISAEEYERLQEEVRKRQFNELKRQRTAEVGVNLAGAIMTILAQQGLPAGLPAIALATATSALQTAAIQSAQYAKGGMLKGDSHAQGGIPMSIGGKKIVEAEGGEAIINKRSTAMFRDQLSAINQAGGGVKFAQGGLLSAPRATVGMGVPSQGIDYDRMAASFARVNIETNIVEISNAQSLQNKITEIRRL